MKELLYEQIGDLGMVTNGKLAFYVDALGMAPNPLGPVTMLRNNGYIRVPIKEYLHLFFQVQSPLQSPFPAAIETPEGDSFPNINSEAELRKAIEEIMKRPRTAEVVDYLTKLADQ
jgi:hypothetical protein